MKNKKLQWVLLPAVLLIWGYVGYRFFSGMQGNTPVPLGSGKSQVLAVADVDTLRYELKLNYPDPFLKNQKRRVVSSPDPAPGAAKAPPKPKVKVTVQPMPVRWPDIAYKGQIEKKGAAAPLCIVEIGKALHFMRVGGEEQGIKLLKVYTDSIQVEYLKREKKTIRR
jgi:hypothetical protein